MIGGLAMALVVGGVVATMPLYPVTTPTDGSWGSGKPLGKDVYLGDIRAVVTPTAAGEVVAQIFWRRRDPNPSLKGVVVTTAAGAIVSNAVADVVESDCGIIRWTPPSGKANANEVYYVYYLPHHQSGGGAGLHFHWLNCTGQTKESGCVTTAVKANGDVSGSASQCTALLPNAQIVTRLENRPNNAGSRDHTPSGEPFHGFTAMEFVATPDEQATVVAAAGNTPMLAFMETRENMVRMFAGPRALPARWARQGAEVTSLQETAVAGEFFTFQVGCFNPTSTPVSISSVTFQNMTLIGGGGGDPAIAASAFTCLNLGGTDEHGVAFTKNVTVAGGGSVVSLWVGLDIPTSAAGNYSGAFTIVGVGGTLKTLHLNLVVTMGPDGKALTDHGDSDVYKMSRLRWLDSDLGIDDTVSRPFTDIKVLPGAALQIQLLNKVISVGTNGLVEQVTVTSNKTRLGKPTTETYVVFPASSSGVALELHDSFGHVLPITVKEAAKVTSATASDVSWSATLVTSEVLVLLTANVDFTGYATYEVAFSALTGNSAKLGDVQLRLGLAGGRTIARTILGMGNEGQEFVNDVAWRWSNASGECDVWLGRVEAGVYLKLIGDGTRWENPQYSRDYPIIPFVPPTWGGASAINGQFGVNISADVGSPQMVAFSGPRTVTATPTTFKFDLMFTPSKPVNMTSHFEQRYLQIGYGGVPMMTPQAVKDMGVSVVTLHQGIGGFVNGTMVNPYINWPFVPEVVSLLDNFTSDAHSLGLRVKFYYTIRELTNHAVELFALKALQGEILTDEDPYTIPQKGYCHDWDCHGGAVYLHEHMVNDYVYCWQQGLSDGEWDAASCDMGVSRWFNYYANGAYWSAVNAPHIDGIYYDGVNFDRQSFRRIRKLLDAGSPNPLIDIHTGEVSDEPSSVRYIGHYPYVEKAWNGEGFKFGSDKFYWLVDASGLTHGITADRLGGGGLDARGMLFGMTQRNSASAPHLWQFWDQQSIQDTTMVGWWEDDCPVNASVGTTSPPTPPPPPSGTCNATMKSTVTHGSFPQASGGPGGNIGFGGTGCGGPNRQYPELTADEAIGVCCSLGPAACAGISIAETSPPGGKSHGCFKKNAAAGVSRLQGYDGYYAHPEPPPSGACADDDFAVTVFTEFESHAIVVIGGWCGKAAPVTLNVDWAALGLDPAAATVLAPAIPSVQSAVPATIHDGTITVAVPVNGLILVVSK